MSHLIFILLMLSATSFGGEGSDNFLIDGLPPAAEPSQERVEERAFAIGKKLRCPVCQGLSIADSNAEGAVMIQRRINELVAAGYTEIQIQDYFIDKYGEWIMLEPKPEGLNLLIWIAPIAAGGLGIIGLASTSRRRRPPPASPTAISPSTSYEDQLLQELEHDV